MADDPRAIDVSVLADLVRIKTDEDLLADRLAKMEATREKVSAVVYRRVRADYEAKKAALESQARAPREKAGKEYAKLRVLVAGAEKALEEARLDDEELEFRHSLGEFPEEEFQSRVGAVRDRLAAKQGELDSLARTKAEFLNAFGSEAELDRAASNAPPVVTAPIAAPESTRASATAAAERARVATVPAGPPRVPAGPSEATVAGDFSPQGTQGTRPMPAPQPAPAPHAAPPPPPAPPPVAAAPPPVAAPPPPPAAPAPPPPPAYVAAQTSPTAPTAVGTLPGEEHGATMVMALPRVAVLYEDKPEEEFVLKREPTHIGRLPRNTIQLPFPDVSREHATILPEGSRYKIVDRGSENGIYVNGARVTEHLLADGDVIQVGRRRLAFRT
ncbi:MAG TPA: FHA domain-containing protein [Thermoanaerobaculia bacterium]|nr:FHA domain-containing protein [Thermoanaerobaculia bacterium]